MPRRPRLIYVTTVPTTPYLLLRGQLAQMRDWGFDVHVVSSPGQELDAVAAREGVTVHAVPMPRDPDPRGDAVALLRLVRLFRRLKPDIVNASTPKAGLLGMMAARISRVPVRIYLLRGLRLETSTGRLRTVLEASERLSSACSHQVIAVSRSLRATYVAGGFVPPEKCRVLGAGSSNGVDPSRFEATPSVRAEASALRRRLEIPDAAPVIGFAGRMVSDKGIVPLLDAFDALRREYRAHLVLVGDDMAGDSVAPDIRRRVQATPGAHVLPRMDELAPFYALITVLAFPSLREGFPNVPVECAAAETPVVGFRSTGIVDAIRDGQTGLIVDPEARALEAGLRRYLDDDALAAAHGAAGRRRVIDELAPKTVWAAWRAEYVRLLASRGCVLPEGAR